MKRMVQIFLSPPPSYLISEVTLEDTGEVTCTCPGFRSRSTCKHADEVRRRIELNNGDYPMEVSKRATDRDAEVANSSEEAFRAFVVKFARIEVL